MSTPETTATATSDFLTALTRPGACVVLRSLSDQQWATVEALSEATSLPRPQLLPLLIELASHGLVIQDARRWRMDRSMISTHLLDLNRLIP